MDAREKALLQVQQIFDDYAQLEALFVEQGTVDERLISRIHHAVYEVEQEMEALGSRMFLMQRRGAETHTISKREMRQALRCTSEKHPCVLLSWEKGKRREWSFSGERNHTFRNQYLFPNVRGLPAEEQLRALQEWFDTSLRAPRFRMTEEEEGASIERVATGVLIYLPDRELAPIDVDRLEWRRTRRVRGDIYKFTGIGQYQAETKQGAFVVDDDAYRSSKRWVALYRDGAIAQERSIVGVIEPAANARLSRGDRQSG